MTCPSCGTENDLDSTQTCVRCGAPLVGKAGIFRPRVILGVAGALVALWVLWMIGVVAVQAACR